MRVILSCLPAGLLMLAAFEPGHADEPPRLRSPADVQAEVESMQRDKVAWRQIAWKTCLLEGLAESRKQHKPLMLWIFIDRPIDDERC